MLSEKSDKKEYIFIKSYEIQTHWILYSVDKK